MSAIGGMVNWETKNIDSRPLFEMSRAMLLRGGARRRAYIHGSVALVQNDESSALPQLPRLFAEDQRRLAAIIDGTPRLSSSGEELGDALYDPTETETLLRAYHQLGTSLADALNGNFALAITDEERAELYLARDRDGTRPLFYCENEQTFFFASEIRALLRIQNPLFRVDTERVRSHLCSPCGASFAEDLYCGVSSLPTGHSAVFSRLGLRIFPNQLPPQPENTLATQPRLSLEFYLPDEEELARMLTELLFAFEAPEFDHLMPSLLHHLSQKREQGCPPRLLLEDPMLHLSLRYANTRADRIGAMKKITLIPTAAERSFVREKDLKRLEKTLRALLGSIDTTPLRALLGEAWSEEITREKNTARRIRMEGMAYQTILWFEHFPLWLT